MINGKKVLAIIPARSGSKGLPGKNIKLLCGKPLIAWSIDAGLKSRYIDKMVVSTDAEEVRMVALEHGACAPFLRPKELATDTSTSFDVLTHAIEVLAQDGNRFDIIVLLEPTSPLRDVSDIDEALERMLMKDADSTVSVCAAETVHPVFMFHLGHDLLLAPYQNEGFKVLRRQDLSDVYFLDGTVYASKIESLLLAKTFCQHNTVAHVVPKWKSLEIDDEIDFVMVEAIMKYKGFSR